MRRAAVFILSLALAGCERTMHDMYDQPRYKPLAASTQLPGGTASQPPPAGTVPASIGSLAFSSSGRRGSDMAREDALADAAQSLPAVTPALLRRGQDRYAIYCLPCHGPGGAGDGYVVHRGFPKPPPLDDARLRSAGDRALYDAIAKGYGVMFPFGDRVAPADRWALIAYIRALQQGGVADASARPQVASRRMGAAP